MFLTKELLLKQKKKTKTKTKKRHKYPAHLKGEFFFQLHIAIFFEFFPKIKADIIIFVYHFVHPSPFSTQFSSDQIQNGGVNSDG